MQKRLWEVVKKPEEQLLQGSSRTFMVADGKAHVSEGRAPVDYDWHGMVWSIDTYIMLDEYLAFPLILGLDFLRQMMVQLNVATMSYELKVKGQVRVYPFLQHPQWEQPCVLRREQVTSLFMAVPTEKGGELEIMVSATNVKDIIARHPPEIQPLLNKWATVCSGSLGKTNQATHRIITMDDIPMRSKIYRVSPLKKEVMEREIVRMMREGIIEPSQPPWASPVVLVPKKDGSLRFCVDYRHLNSPRFLPDAAPPWNTWVIAGCQLFQYAWLKIGILAGRNGRKQQGEDSFHNPLWVVQFLDLALRAEKCRGYIPEIDGESVG